MKILATFVYGSSLRAERCSTARVAARFGGFLLAALLALTATLALSGCSRNKEQTAQAAASSRPGLFTIPADQMSHVQVITVEPTTLRRVLRLPGAVAYNAFKTTPVISQVGGPVTRIVVSPGQEVHVGQVMLYVSSPDYTQAQADLQAAQQALAVLGFRNANEVMRTTSRPEIPVLAPIAGEVVERMVAPGQVLQAGTTQCFTISDMSSVWVLVNVYENDLAYVHVGDAVTIRSDAYPQTFHGTISYVGAALDPNSRTLQARIVTANPQQQLKKDMYVTAEVRAGQIPNALTVPDAAVLRDAENLPFVYVDTGNNQFGRRDVQVGESQGGSTQITSGLRPGEKVIGDGSLFLQFANSLQQ